MHSSLSDYCLHGHQRLFLSPSPRKGSSLIVLLVSCYCIEEVRVHLSSMVFMYCSVLKYKELFWLSTKNKWFGDIVGDCCRPADPRICFDCNFNDGNCCPSEQSESRPKHLDTIM